MNKIRDIERIQEILKELNLKKFSDTQVEELWETFSHDGFEKEWLETNDDELEIAKNYINKVYTVTIEEVIQEDNKLLYFILWLLRVYEKTNL